MWNRIDLKMRAKAAFQRNYWNSVAVGVLLLLAVSLTTGYLSRLVSNFVYNVTYHNVMYQYGYRLGYSGYGRAFGASQIYSSALLLLGLSLGVLLVQIFVLNVLQVGLRQFFLVNQTQQAQVGLMGAPFRNGHYLNQVKVMFARNLFTFLWALLFIIPGIIKSYEYRMIPYILAENPGMDRREAFLISKQMMMGRKGAAFMLDLSFIGWMLLGGLTLGILNIFYVNPYVFAADAEMYAANRAIAYQEGYIR
jgi:uncharacterized membrane protein